MAKFSEDELAIIALILDEEEETRRKRKWVHQAWKKRGTEGEFATLYKELVDDGTKFFEYFRMTENSFNLLLNKLEVDIAKQDTRWRKATTPRERLAVCLRYSVTGDAFNTISFSYHIGHSTVQKIGRETCKIIAKNLMTELLPTPTEEMWKKIGNDYQEMWNFPNCIGAIDGKHIVIQAPPNSGSMFFNYKKTFSVVLLALVGAHCNFITVDIGAYGKSSDGGFFQIKAGKITTRSDTEYTSWIYLTKYIH
ncbi:unnamed protein product [Acanthoscelides obtectus]|uniref:DDE Tnp4 domain-containing protein n=1 Tax=Acanthoscelides obtectus TaxID=200917 RepID=A0A9P0JP84_ACAOB|nr:unnamed protein product [Acanthoscelides obtectus]CAK1640225.1 Protein ALP1-like [Acanthoscelides obtectus]